jgi:hypothetical protein
MSFFPGRPIKYYLHDWFPLPPLHLLSQRDYRRCMSSTQDNEPELGTGEKTGQELGQESGTGVRARVGAGVRAVLATGRSRSEPGWDRCWRAQEIETEMGEGGGQNQVQESGSRPMCHRCTAIDWGPISHCVRVCYGNSCCTPAI